MAPPTPATSEVQAWREPETLAMLRCPVTRSPLKPEQDAEGRWWLVADGAPQAEAAPRYPVIDGVPMLVASARVQS